MSPNGAHSRLNRVTLFKQTIAAYLTCQHYDTVKNNQIFDEPDDEMTELEEIHAFQIIRIVHNAAYIITLGIGAKYNLKK